MKTCTSCGQAKPTEEFPKSKACKDGIYPSCKECSQARKKVSNEKIRAADPEAYAARRREYVKRHKRRHPERNAAADRRRSLWSNYKITEAEYDRLTAVQGGVCAVCKKADPNRMLAVDHDHETGVIRGLLCGSCNLAIGSLGDSVEGLMKAVSYLERGEHATHCNLRQGGGR